VTLRAARLLQQERLQIHRRLADAYEIGATLWNLAQLDLAESKISDAVPRIVEAYNIVSQLGRAEGIAVIGKVLGQILAENDQPDEARSVLRRSIEMYRKLGRDADAQQVEDLLRTLS
jgi:hypothetical protein